VKVVVAAAKSGAHQVSRPWVGASFQSVSRTIAESLGMSAPEGALVTQVHAGGPAAEAGVKRGDVILAVDGEPVEDPRGLGYRIATHPLGGAVKLLVFRNGQKLDLSMKLERAPEIPPRDPVAISGRNPFAGGTFWNLSPAVEDEMSLSGDDHGVVVAKVSPDSDAANVGLQKGDIVLAVNGVRVQSTQDLRRAAEARERYWKLSIERGGQVLTSIVGG